MTISSETNRNIYNGDNTSTVFPYTFKILEDDHILVSKKNIETGVVTTLALTTDYSVDGVGDSAGGNVTLVATSDSDYTYIFTRAVPKTQETDYNEFDTFPAESHEAALDKLTMIVQHLQEQVNRALKVDIGSAINGELQTPQDSAGLVVKVNGAGTGFEYGAIPDSSYSFPLATTGYLVQTGTGTATTRAVQGTSNEISVSNPDGVAGNTVISLPNSLTFTGKTVTDGTFNDVTLNNPTIVGGPSTDTGDFVFTDNSATVSGTNDPMLLSGNGTGYIGLTSSDVRFLSDQPITDSSGNEFIKFSKTASAVNEFTIVNAATGNVPILKSSGQADKGMTLSDSNGNELLKMVATASAVNEFTITNKPTGIAPIFQSSGEANIGWKFADSNGNTILQGNSVASAVNYIIVKNKATGTAPAITASGDSNTGMTLEDTNGNELIKLTSVASAVNEVTVTNSATGVAPTIRSSGETNKGLILSDSNSNPVLALLSTASSANYVTITNDSSAFPTIGTAGSTADRYLTLQGAGTGYARFIGGAGAGTGHIQAWIKAGGQSILHNANSVTGDRTVLWPDTDISNFLVQRELETSTSMATGTTVIPFDDTIPQNTEGNEYITCTITPKTTTNKLKISAGAFCASSAAGNTMIIALFQDSTADALVAFASRSGGANIPTTLSLNFEMTAGTTSATTFKIRIGGASAGTTTVNGVGGGRIFGGVARSFLLIEEYAA